MKFLSGGAHPQLDAIAKDAGIGLLNTWKIGYATARMALYSFFAIDCGAFSYGADHRDFAFVKWARWMEKRAAQLKAAGIMDRLLFAVVPDAIDVCDDTCPDAIRPNAKPGKRCGVHVTSHPAETLERFRTWAPWVRDLGMPTALVIQPGMRPSDIPWDLVDAIFIGGSDDWKEDPNGAGRAVRMAKGLGKHVHVGRVNTQRRIAIMADWGVDSIDGTKLTNGVEKNLPQLVDWMAAAA